MITLESTINVALQRLQEIYKVEGDKRSVKDEYKDALNIASAVKLMRFNKVNYFYNSIKNKWVSFVSIDTLTNYLVAEYSNKNNTYIKNISFKLQGMISSGKFDIDLNLHERYFFFQNGYVYLPQDGSEPIFNTVFEGFYDTIPMKPIQYNYNPKKYYESTNPEIVNSMNKLFNWFAKGDAKERATIMTMIGICANNIRTEHFFNLFGAEGSGKSTLVDYIVQLVGSNYLATTSVNKLNDKFGLISLVGKKLLLNADASKSTIDEGMLKELTTIGQKHTIELKGSNTPLTITLPLNIMIVSNHKLQFKSLEGINRRYVLLKFPFKQSYVDKNFQALDFNEFQTIKTIVGESYKFTPIAIECMLQEVLLETQKWLNRKKVWEFSAITTEAYDDLILANNNVLQWWEEYDFIRAPIITKPDFWEITGSGDNWYIKGDDLYSAYRQTILNNGGKPRGKNQFIDGFREEMQKLNYPFKINHLVAGVGKRIVLNAKELRQKFPDKFPKLHPVPPMN